jgi:hypothetical protein
LEGLRGAEKIPEFIGLETLDDAEGCGLFAGAGLKSTPSIVLAFSLGRDSLEASATRNRTQAFDRHSVALLGES